MEPGSNSTRCACQERVLASYRRSWHAKRLSCGSGRPSEDLGASEGAAAAHVEAVGSHCLSDGSLPLHELLRSSVQHALGLGLT
jgi:hypothetical protein